MPDQINLEIGAITAVDIALHIRVINPADIGEVELQLRLVTELSADAIPLAEEGKVLITGRTCAGGPSIDQR